MANIDLGVTPPSPSSDAMAVKAAPSPQFPSFHVRGKPELHKLPVGKKFKFHAVGEVTHASKGKTGADHSHEIAVHSMKPMDMEEGEGTASEESLDKALGEIEKKKSKK